MVQHFHNNNTFIILLYLILTCKELILQQLSIYYDDYKMPLHFHKRNTMSTTFSQQIISSRLLQVAINWQKSNFIDRFKLELITIYYL